MKKPVTLDYVIVGAVIALSLGSLLLFVRPNGATVRVESDGKTLYTGDIQNDHIIETEGNTVTVRDGHVTVTRADCPDGLCMHGEATATHPLVCLPNRLSVTVVSEEVTLDGVTY